MAHRAQCGAVTLWLVAALLSLVLFTAVALDTARLIFQRQQLQSIADLAATELGLISPYFLDPNKKTQAEQTVATLYGDRVDTLSIKYGTAMIEEGRWVMDTSASAVTGYPAAKVVVGKTVPQSLVAGGILNNKHLTLYAEAAIQKAGVISFGVGSRTLGTNSEAGLLNLILGNILGITLDLDVADYNGLVGGEIKLGQLLNALAVSLDLGTPQEVLESELSLLTMLQVYAGLLGSEVPEGLNLLINDLVMADTIPDIVLGDIFRLSETNTEGAALTTVINGFSLVQAAIFAADSSHFITLPSLGINVPNVTNIALTADVVTPPSFTYATLPVVEEDPPSVSNSQINLSLSANLDIANVLTSAVVTVSSSLGLNNVVVQPLTLDVSASKSTATLTNVDLTSTTAEAEFATQSSLVNISVQPLVINANISISSLNLPIVITANIAVANEAQVASTQMISLAQLPEILNINREALFDTEINVEVKLPNVSILNVLAPLLNSTLKSVLNLTLSNVLSDVLSDILLPTLETLGVQVGGTDMWVDAIQASPSGLIL